MWRSLYTVWQPEGKIQHKWDPVKILTISQLKMNLILLFWVYFISCLVLPSMKHLFFSFLFISFKLQRKGDFQMKRNISQCCFHPLRRRGWCSCNPGQSSIESVSGKMVMVTWKQEFYYGDFVQAAMRQTCGWRWLAKDFPFIFIFVCLFVFWGWP